MITIGFSTKGPKPNFIQHVKDTCGLGDVEIIQKINNGEKSLSVVYNEILKESSNNIVVLCHDDILFEKPYWAKRVIEHFQKRPEFGILGVAGTRYYPSSGMWWEISSEMIGQVYHQHEGKKWLSSYNEPFGNKVIDTIIVDGVFMMIQKDKIKTNFNEEVKGFHFYDTTFTFENHLSGVKVGVVSNIPITHLSIGATNQQWEENRQDFSKKYKDSLPQILDNNLPTFTPNSKQPLVSVIMPVYNYGKMFQKSIESVFNSTYKNIELVIINDGSTDEYVLNKLKTLSTHPNIKIINQENGGPSSARNNGIKNSNGEYILPLDSDDMISPEYIQTCVNILRRDKNLSPIYCDTNHTGQMNGVEVRPEWSVDRLIFGPFIVNCSMFTREAFNSAGGYDENLKGWEDYDLWIRMMKSGYVGKRIPKPLFTYFHHENDGTVSTNANKNMKELYSQIMTKNNTIKMKILVKFPTRGRKDKFFEVLDLYYNLLNNLDLTEFLITIDSDDLTMNNDEVISKLSSYKNLKYTIGLSKNKIDAVNRDIEVGDWDIILLASDDMIPKIKGYDDIIRSKMIELYRDTDGVLWFNDGNRKNLNTLSILGRKYYERFNYIYNPEYKSLWADNEFMTVANMLQKQTFIDQVIIHHEHPDWGYGHIDFVHELNAQHDNYDREIFMSRKSRNFDL